MRKAYPYLFEPEDHPDYTVRQVKATTREDLGHRIQFTSARMFSPDPETFRLRPYQDYLDWYTKVYDLGDVVWPVYNFTDARDAKELIDEIKQRGLYVFDIWGYVPGSYSNFRSCGEVDYPPDLADYMKAQLGSRFLGFDNGEQDGRYIGSYAPQMCPAGRDRQDQYDQFQHHFSFMHRHLRNHVSALCSLNLGHYFLKEQDVTIIGSECAQALPNVNLWYACLRGAGKQYGVLWFGNASVWNRWGWKEYDPAVTYEQDSSAKGGPEHGTSLSLLRRILYTHYTYNCDLLGFESGMLLPPDKEGDSPWLTPIGQINRDGHAFVKTHGYPGAQHTPIAILLDFHNGWVPPRHLYTRLIYRTWGNEPYTAGDYQLHALFSMIYPQYEEAGFYRDETGFLTPTPHGDIFDVLFSDAAPEVLATYNQIFLGGEMPRTLEDFDKLRRFVEDGGRLILFAGQIEKAWQSFAGFRTDLLAWFGIRTLDGWERQEAGATVRLTGAPTVQVQDLSFDRLRVQLDPAAHVLASIDGLELPLAYELTCGAGHLTVLLVPYGINAEPVVTGSFAETGQIARNVENQPIVRSYRFLPFVSTLLADVFDQEQLIRLTNTRLQYTVNLQTPNRLLLTVVNNTPCEQHFELAGEKATGCTLKQIPIQDVDRTSIGYFAPGYQEQTAAAALSGQSVRPMDLAMYVLESDESFYEAKPRLERTRHTGKRYLRLDPHRAVQKQVNRLPTIDQHFRGISLDARYFLERDEAVLETEGAWLKRHGMDVLVDCSGLFNNYPDWSQVDVVMERYARTLREFTTCLDRAAGWGCSKVVLMLQRRIETGYSEEQMMQSILRTLFYLADVCKSHRMVLYVQNGTPDRLLPKFDDLAVWLKDKQVRSIRLAVNVGHALMNGEDPDTLLNQHSRAIGGLLVSAPEQDAYGQMIDRHAPVATSAFPEQIAAWTSAATACCDLDFIVQDSCYQNWDEAWVDVTFTSS